MDKLSIAVLFINILTYQNDESKKRRGAELDVQYLQNVFKDCKLVYFIDLKAKKMKEVVREFFNSPTNKKFDHLFLIIGSHGTSTGAAEEALLPFDGKKVKINDFLEIFKETPITENKKITCIFQICRGREYSLSYSYPLLDDHSSSSKVNYNDKENAKSNSIVPVTVINVTQPGCLSFRCPKNGCAYFRAMNDVSKRMSIENTTTFFECVEKQLQKLLPLGLVQQPDIQKIY